jgi:uncharacterized protein
MTRRVRFATGPWRAQCSGASTADDGDRMNSRKPLLVDVFQLARDAGTVEGELPLSALPRLSASLLRPEGRLHYRVHGERDERGRPGAGLHLDAELALECQRCNREMNYSLQREAHFRFVATEEELNALPIDVDDLEVIVGSRQLDLQGWLEDEAILSLPLVPTHRDCTPSVHPMLLQDEADPASERPNPFAVLAGLKPGRKPD